MTKLNQIVAVEKGVKTSANRTITDIYHSVQNPTPLNGLTRTYEPKFEDGDQLPPEEVLVQYTVQDLLYEMRDAAARLVDVTATKDYGNVNAKADVKIGDRVFLHDAPVPLLLSLEKMLVDMRTFVNRLPLLDPSIRWTEDDTTGTYRSESVQTTRTQKTPKAMVLAPATDRHPAQVQSYNVDEVVGTWTLTRFSGAITKARQEELLERIDKMLQAVKYAREEANSTEVTDQHVGEEIFAYLFN